jgi:hypothetical protein
MKKRLFSIMLVTVILTSLLFLTQCDMIIGSGKNANVGIDLGDLFDTSGNRDIGVKQGFSSVVISVFGPGMQSMQKTVSAGARYVNLTVPTGAERHFTVEAFLEPNRIPPFNQYPHLVSLKARAIADLRPGKFVGLSMRMVAGATQLLVPDRNAAPDPLIYQANSIAFAPFASGRLGALNGASNLSPSDIDIASDGWIFSAHWYQDTADSIIYGNDLSGSVGTGTISNLGSQTYAMAMDRDANLNIDRDVAGTIDTNILYFSDLDLGPPIATYNMRFVILDHIHDATPVFIAQSLRLDDPTYGTISVIRGMAVDPWTHHLFIVGEINGNQAIIEYDPTYAEPNVTNGGYDYGRIVSAPVTNPNFKTLNDIIVKDTGIFVLNQATPLEPNIPAVMKFDKNLNYISGFGQTLGDATTHYNSGEFYTPVRFFAQENEGLYIIDDGAVFNKVIFINEKLEPASWKTYPASGEDFFVFFNRVT